MKRRVILCLFPESLSSLKADNKSKMNQGLEPHTDRRHKGVML